MEIPLYLAMTAAEFRSVKALERRMAWLSCLFSPYGTGLSNIPKTLPSKSMLMLNDRMPICGHDPELIAKTLCSTAKELECSGIVLDFQRSGYDALYDVVHAVISQACCPVGVSNLYAAEFDCPVLVPPIAPDQLPEDALSLWQGREIWLELSTEATQILVTENGSRYASIPCCALDGFVHTEPVLHCHYTITVSEDQVLFRLSRFKEDQASLLESVHELGVCCAFGLWQEMKDS